jgi:hypothetical protein
MLTPNTQIPTSTRGQVRALVKAHRAWPAFLNKKGLISASAKNVDLIEFTLRHPALKAQIEQILQNYVATAPQQNAAVLIQINRVEQLLKAYAIRRKATKPRIRVSAVTKLAQPSPKDLRSSPKEHEEALNDFNYVGSKHHY